MAGRETKSKYSCYIGNKNIFLVAAAGGRPGPGARDGGGRCHEQQQQQCCSDGEREWSVERLLREEGEGRPGEHCDGGAGGPVGRRG